MTRTTHKSQTDAARTGPPARSVVARDASARASRAPYFNACHQLGRDDRRVYAAVLALRAVGVRVHRYSPGHLVNGEWVSTRRLLAIARNLGFHFQ